MSEHADEPLNLDTETLLGKAVDALGGSRREGQVRMATAVSAALEKERHLAVPVSYTHLTLPTKA